MTRETKIGLLVGLAFIIVIGILLSDHLSSSTEAPSATLVQAGTNLRQQVATPAGTQSPLPQVTAPTTVTPTNPVATQRDLTPPTVPSAIVQVGPVTPATGGVMVTAKSPETTPPGEPPVTMVGNTPSGDPSAAPAELANGSDTGNPLTTIAAQHGEQLISPNGQPSSPLPSPKAVASSTGGKDYVVQSGDTISKLATRFLGSNTKANRDLIIKTNPSLLANPDKLIVGKSYKMPAATSAASAVSTPAPAVASLPETAPIARTAPVQLASAATIYYTVKPGDSLWKIASDQLGMGGKGVAAIKELNKDTLNGSDTVTVDMKLRMPGKAIASAS